MEVLHSGTPIKLYGECGGCHTVVETDSAEAAPVHQGAKWEFTIKCPTCSCMVSAFYRLMASNGVKYGGRPSLTVDTSERAKAAAIANRLLDEPYADPDDDARVLARQFERSQEQIQKLKPYCRHDNTQTFDVHPSATFCRVCGERLPESGG